jgi:RecB family exonuclease
MTIRSEPYTHLSPSTFETMRACRLRASYSSQQKWAGPNHPAAHLGNVVHRVLQSLVRAGVPQAESKEWAYHRWQEELEAERSASRECGTTVRWGEPESWPDLQITRARLMFLAHRIASLLENVPAGAEVLTETRLSGAQKKLRGQVDLIIRGTGTHFVGDYKTGSLSDPGSKDLRESYVRQLRLYAFMEYETTDEWPTNAYLFPLSGPAIEVSVHQNDCRDLAREAVELLDAYNAATPAEQPAAATPKICSSCPYSSKCTRFWEEIDQGWAEQVQAVQGTITAISSSTAGGYSVYVDVASGSIDLPRILVRNVDPSRFPVARSAEAGQFIAITGLRKEFRRESFAIGPWTSIDIRLTT